MNNDKPIPLTTGGARTLLKALFAGKGYHKRAEMIDAVTQHHTPACLPPNHHRKQTHIIFPGETLDAHTEGISIAHKQVTLSTDGKQRTLPLANRY